MEARERVLEAAENIVKGVEDARDRAVIEDAHPADLAQALHHLPVSSLVGIFRLLRPEQASGVLSELDDAALIQLVQALEDVEVSDILNRMPAEHAADIVEELPAEQAEKILDLMEEEKSEDVQELLEYPEQSAGRLMSPEVVAIHESATVEDAIQHIRKSVTEEKAFELYVVDDHRHLVGVVPLRRLLVADPRTRILAVRSEDVVSVTPETDREDVARVVAKYDLVRVPVVDAQHRLVGAITVDDVVEILGEEASEDIFRIAGSDYGDDAPAVDPHHPADRDAGGPGDLLLRPHAGAGHPAGRVHPGDPGHRRQHRPAIGDHGRPRPRPGHVRLDRWWEALRRQVQTTTIIGAVCAAVVGTIGAFWHSPVFGLVVAVSKFVSVNLSGPAGTAIPMISKRLGFDPALTAGPFEAALQDVLGVTIFLSLATALLRWLA